MVVTKERQEHRAGNTETEQGAEIQEASRCKKGPQQEQEQMQEHWSLHVEMQEAKAGAKIRSYAVTLERRDSGAARY